MKLIAHVPNFDIPLDALGDDINLYSGIYISKSINVGLMHTFLQGNAKNHGNKLEYIIFGAELQLEDIQRARHPYLHEFKWIIEMEKRNYPCPLVNEFSTSAIKCDNLDDCLLYSLRNYIIVENTKLLQEVSEYNIGDRIITNNTAHKKGLRITNYAVNSMIKEKIKKKAKKETLKED